jgi:DNA-binding MarR family transcriptional regulator
MRELRSLRRKVEGLVEKEMYRQEPTETLVEERLGLGHLDQHLGYFVRRLQLIIFKDFIRELAAVKLRPAQYSVLLLIEANPGSSQAAIGRTLGIERARLARLLHDLEGREWIERRSASSDGRSHALFLVSNGAKALARSKKLAARHEAHMTKLLGAKRKSALLDLLKDLG